jgi:DNA-directed RNA polymerase specialized sigma24 family protein
MTVLWADVFERSRERLRALARRSFRSEPTTADDVVSRASVEIAERLQANPSKYPAEWFQEVKEPVGFPLQAAASSSFLAFATRVVERRTIDEVRARYRASHFRGLVGEGAIDTETPESMTSRRQLLELLAEAIDECSGEDRELLLRGESSAGATPGRDRMRLLRLRRRIAERLVARLKAT